MLEVPQLAVALEAMGAPLEALAEARAARPRMALLCTARPLFFTWTPDSRSIIAVRAVNLTPAFVANLALFGPCMRWLWLRHAGTSR